MRSLIGVLAAWLMWAAGPAPAWATPTLAYGFSVTSYTCLLTDCSDQTFYTQKLSSMRLGLTTQALTDGAAQLNFSTQGWGTGSTFIESSSQQGFASADLSAWGVDLDFATGECQAAWLCRVQADLQVSTLLQGMFRLDTSNDNVIMASSGSLWSGTIFSDGPFMTFGTEMAPRFSGEWRLLNEVSEPGSWALVALALAGVGWMRQRSMARIQRSVQAG